MLQEMLERYGDQKAEVFEKTSSGNEIDNRDTERISETTARKQNAELRLLISRRWWLAKKVVVLSDTCDSYLVTQCGWAGTTSRMYHHVWGNHQH